MTQFQGLFRSAFGLIPVLLVAFVAGCGGGGIDPILGNPGAGIAPVVSVTSPAARSPVVTGVATNSRVFATFSRPMAGATLTAASFTLACPAGTPVTATVTYDAATRVATLTPSAPLPAGTLCVATVTTAAQDTQGFALAANFAWSFMTGAGPDAIAPTVTTVSPTDGSVGVCRTKIASAVFSEPMDPITINAATFTVTDGGLAVAGTVGYDLGGQIASFAPTNAAGFDAGKTFVATIKSGAAGVRDAAGNALAADRVWSFTTGAAACAGALGAVDLGTIATFGAFGGGAGVTNQGINTVVGGDLGTTAACTTRSTSSRRRRSTSARSPARSPAPHQRREHSCQKPSPTRRAPTRFRPGTTSRRNHRAATRELGSLVVWCWHPAPTPPREAASPSRPVT